MNQEVDDLPALTAPDPELVRGEAPRRRRVRRISWWIGALAMAVLIGVGVFVARGPSSPEPLRTADVIDTEPEVVDLEPEVVVTEPDEVDVEVDLSGPTFAPEAEFIFTGTWSPVVLRVDGDTIDLTQIPDADMTVRGRSFWTNDGCNSTGRAPILPEPDGRIELIPGGSTLVGCGNDLQSNAFGAAIRDATSWGVTPDAQLVLVGPSTHVRFELTEMMALTPIDGEWILRGITEGLAGQGDVELEEGDSEVRLTADGSDATIESVGCVEVMTFTIEVGPNRSEGAFRAPAVDPSGCDPLGLAYKAATFLAVSDYFLSAEGFMVFWHGPNQRLAWQRTDT